jgi:hypothetical protein
LSDLENVVTLHLASLAPLSELGGLRITAMDGFDELSKRLKNMTDPNAQRRRIAATRCPIHSAMPTQIRRTSDGWNYSVCCERLGKLAAEAMLAA